MTLKTLKSLLIVFTHERTQLRFDVLIPEIILSEAERAIADFDQIKGGDR